METVVAKVRCSTEGCESSVFARGMCTKHYQIWYRSLNRLPAERTSLVVFTPEKLPLAQAQVSEWCANKIMYIRRELNDAKANLQTAIERKWKVQGWRRVLELCKKRITFYEKIKDAVAAGYLIIPNFPIEAFAVRVREDAAPKQMASHSEYSIREQSPALLPTGEGEYKSPIPLVGSRPNEVWNEKTQELERKQEWFAKEFDEVAFPVTAVKPLVMDATGRAMALKVFDAIGLVGSGRQKDPIVVGRIIDPRTTRWNERHVTFFIAWWLNLDIF